MLITGLLVSVLSSAPSNERLWADDIEPGDIVPLALNE